MGLEPTGPRDDLDPAMSKIASDMPVPRHGSKLATRSNRPESRVQGSGRFFIVPTSGYNSYLGLRGWAVRRFDGRRDVFSCGKSMSGCLLEYNSPSNG